MIVVSMGIAATCPLFSVEDLDLYEEARITCVGSDSIARCRRLAFFFVAFYQPKEQSR